MQTLVAVLTLLAAAGAPSWTGSSGGLTVTVTGTDVRATKDGVEVFSLARRFTDAAQKRARAWAGDLAQRPDDLADARMSEGQTCVPLALVGPYLALQVTGGSFWPGAPHPLSFARYDVIDLRAPDTPVTLETLFPEEAVRAALERLEDDVPTPVSSFAFHEVKGGRVAVGVGIPNDDRIPSPVKLVRLWLDTPPALRAELEAARTGRQGFLMKDAPRRLAGVPAVTLDSLIDLRPLIAEARAAAAK